MFCPLLLFCQDKHKIDMGLAPFQFASDVNAQYALPSEDMNILYRVLLYDYSMNILYRVFLYDYNMNILYRVLLYDYRVNILYRVLLYDYHVTYCTEC